MPKPNDIKTPIHPGEILLAEFLEPMAISQYRLAKDINVPQIRISQIVRGHRAVTADTAMRLSRYFGNSVDYWLGLQMHYDMEVAQDALAGRIDKEVKPRKKTA
jgi:addiction module HigA family antidote